MKELRIFMMEGVSSYIFYNPLGVGGTASPSGVQNIQTLAAGASLNVSRTYIDFGSVPVFFSRREDVYFRNTGTQTLHVRSILAPYGFSASASSLTIPPGESRTLTITFSPYFEQLYQGSVSFSTDDPNYSGGSIFVMGRGVRN